MKKYVFRIECTGGITVEAKSEKNAFEKVGKILDEINDESLTVASMNDAEVKLRFIPPYLEEIYD